MATETPLAGARRAFVIFVVTILLLIAVLFVWVAVLKLDSLHKDKQIRHQAHEAQVLARKTRALAKRTQAQLDVLVDGQCKLKADLKGRIAGAKLFLKRNPNGGLGFTRAEILAQQRGPKRTLKALSGLHCPVPKHTHKEASK